MMTTLEDSSARTALVIAHPGHELRVHGWLHSTRPCVFVLTDGSGRSGRSRLESTTRVLEAVGARPGAIYGRFTDAEIYAAILDRSFAAFFELVDDLVAPLVAGHIERVASDACEGFNPAHDVCRLVTDAAIELAGQASGRSIASYAFPLVGPPVVDGPGAIRLALDDEAFARKLTVARGYVELSGEVNRALAEHGTEAFRTECFVPVRSTYSASQFEGDAPFYERYGERQVTAGFYARVIRHRDHIAPLAEALRRYAEGSG